MRSTEYWRRRAEALQRDIQDGAELAIAEVTALYDQAFDAIDRDVKKTLRAFMRLSGLPEDKAKSLINAAEEQGVYQELLELADRVSDPVKKQEVLNLINAQAYGARMIRLEAVKLKAYAHLQRVATAVPVMIKPVYQEAVKKSRYGTVYDLAKGLNCGVDFSLIPEQAVEKVIQAPFCGGNYSDRVWKNTAETARQAQKIITEGLLTGDSYAGMAHKLQEVTDRAQFEATRLIRTDTGHYLEQARLDTYKDIGIKTYRYFAQLSKVTCPSCAELDGKEFPVEEAVEGANYPKLHPNCHCITIMGGINLSTRAARDPLTSGNYKVDGSVTYKQWYESLSAEQKQAITKYGVMRDHKSADKKQYEQYVSVIGTKNIPKTFEKFQDLKYNDTEKWGFVKLDYKRRNELLKHPELKLPYADRATAAEEKFTKYLFDPTSKAGYPKGKAFMSRLGYHEKNYEKLQHEIIEKASKYPALQKEISQFGIKYEQKVVLYGEKGTPANVVIGWMNKEDKTWMTSVYIREVKKQ